MIEQFYQYKHLCISKIPCLDCTGVYIGEISQSICIKVTPFKSLLEKVSPHGIVSSVRPYFIVTLLPALYTSPKPLYLVGNVN